MKYQQQPEPDYITITIVIMFWLMVIIEAMWM